MRGFCTIATGSLEYSRLAHNLLLSYRKFTSVNYPFTVFTDKTNDLLNAFDQVIEIPKSEGTFVDKLKIFELCPYDETIFIDADSLAYGDLSLYFDYFSTANSVSCMGEVFPAESINGWFRKSDIGKYAEDVEYTLGLHGGIYYVRKTPFLKDFYQTCKDIEKSYKQIFFRFKYLTEPADEPIVALAMAIHKLKPIEASPEILAFYRDSTIHNIDIVEGKLCYQVKSGKTENGLLVHWATSNTRKALYRIEAKKLEWCIRHPDSKPSNLLKLYWKAIYLVLTTKDRFYNLKERFTKH